MDSLLAHSMHNDVQPAATIDLQDNKSRVEEPGLGLINITMMNLVDNKVNLLFISQEKFKRV